MTLMTRRSRIGETLARFQEAGDVALVPFLTVGYPERETTREVIPALVEGGAAMIELGIPFSDPLADGATIQHASEVALRNGVNLLFCFDTVRAARASGVDVPLILMGYYNPILRFGVERFAATCADAGVDGVIVPDLPVDESAELHEACRRHGRDLIFMLAPTSTDDLIEAVVRRASGFIYCVSVTGVTGARSHVAGGLDEFIGRVRRHTDLPLAIGFGISRPEHVREAARLATAVVVGSAVIDCLDAASPDERPQAIRAFVRQLLGG